jgi:hypothetical protein
MVQRFILLWLARASQRMARMARTDSRAKTTSRHRRNFAIIVREQLRDFPATTPQSVLTLFVTVLFRRQIRTARKIPYPIALRRPRARSSFRAAVLPSEASFVRAATPPMQWRLPWAARVKTNPNGCRARRAKEDSCAIKFHGSNATDAKRSVSMLGPMLV